MECLFCGSTQLKKAGYPRETEFNSKRFGYLYCKSCHLVFINPLPNADDYKKMYSANYHDSFYFKENDHEPDYLESIVTGAKGNKKFLDYGCGDGGVLKYVRNFGLQCYGTEYDPVLVGKLNELNPNFKVLHVNEFWDSDNQLYNFIHLGDVLEHIEEPFLFLQKLGNKLEPETGRIIVRGPLENNHNLALSVRKFVSALITVVKPSQTASHVPYHISFSNTKNQLALFKRAGLKTVDYLVTETHWPYPSQNNGSLGNRGKFFIAEISQRISSQLSKSLGNRFLYVGKR